MLLYVDDFLMYILIKSDWGALLNDCSVFFLVLIKIKADFVD